MSEAFNSHACLNPQTFLSPRLQRNGRVLPASSLDPEFCLQSVQTRHNKMRLYPYTALTEEPSALSERQQLAF